MAQAQIAHPSDDSEIVDVDFLLGRNGTGDDTRQVFKIGDLAKEFGVTLRTLRFYEDRGLLNPERRGTTRLFSRRDRARLRMVLLAKVLGFSLTEAKQMIEIYDQPEGRRRQLEVVRERFEEQHQILLDQQREIEASIRAMETSIGFVREQLQARADA